MPKIEPAVQTYQFAVDPSTSAYQYIDTMQVASLLNRRAMRQGHNVAVAGFTILSTTPQNILIEKLPNTWVTSASWEKSFRAWDRQRDEVLEDAETGSVEARYADFKVYFDEVHKTIGSLIPNAVTLPGPGTGTLPDWDYSRIVIPNDSAVGVNGEYYLHMIGPDVSNSKGVISGYASSRAVPTSPDPETPATVVTANWLNAMFDVGDNNEDVLDLAVYNNRNLPYDQTAYPGETFFETEIVDFASVTATTVGGMTRAKGSTFPCGLIKLNLSESTQPFVLLVHMVPGPARGYMAESMVEM